MKKFKLTKTKKEYFGTTLFQIEALISFGNVSKGDLGGWVEKEENLSQEDNAWVYDNAKVYDNAEVSSNAWVSGNARVSGNAWVYGNARVFGNAEVFGKLKLLAGFFFGIRYKKEDIKFVQVNDDYELVYKGEAKFGEENENLKEIKINGATYVLKD